MIENGRAKHAFAQVQNLNEASIDAYTSYVRKMPMMIQTNGLAQTLAFYLSANHKEYQIVYKDLEKWIKRSETYKRLGLKDMESKQLIEATIDLESQDYRMLTVEILAYLEWLKRFSVARKR